jgi:signal transduction histidine kinase
MVMVVAASMTLEPLLDHVPTAGLIAVVLLVAWIAGLAPALFATALAAVLLAVAPPYEAPGYAAAQITGIVLFVVVSVAISLLASTRRRVECERSLLLERERAARAEAERLSRAKDDFLATVSHDLRAPLTVILGWVEVLRRTEPSRDAVDRALGPIERNTRLQARLIDDLLDVARIVEGTLELQRTRIDLSSLLRHIVESHQPSARSKEVSLGGKTAPDSLYVFADPQRIEQMVGNVISNAIKFTPAGGEVSVMLDREGAHARIVVRDDGLGVAPDVLPHIFEKFRQGEGARAYGGLGLGLAIVKHLVVLHGGAVRAESEGTNRGATFVIELSLAEDSAPVSLAHESTH